MQSRENHLAGIVRRLASAGRASSAPPTIEDAERAASRLSSFPEYNPNPLVETDLDGNVTYVNPAAQELMGGIAGDSPSTHPLAADLGPLLGRLTRQGGGVVSREIRVLDAVFEQKILYIPEAITIRIYSSDVTRIKAAQEAMRAASESASALALQNQILGEVGRVISSSLDINDVYARFGEQMRRLIDFDRLSVVLVNPESNTVTVAYVAGEEARGRQVGEALPLEGTIINEVALSRQAMVIQGSMEELRRRYSNILRYPSSVLAPLIYRGEMFGVLAARSSLLNAFRDEDAEILSRVASQITPAIANSLLYSAIVQTQDDLARSNDDLEQFAYAASHDLQEPLRTIGAYMNLVKSRYAHVLDDTAIEFIDYAVDGAERMRILIDDLLEYSRVDTRGMPLEPVNCNDVVEDALGNLNMAIEDSRAKVEASPLPTINGDRSQLSRMFQNLVGNALKFRQENRRPRVQIWAELRGQEWVFAIKDNGIGISPEHQDRVFEMFSRLHSRARYSGTGIGLALCSKIAQRHGGGIWVESEEGEGSTFRFNIPVMS